MDAEPSTPTAQWRVPAKLPVVKAAGAVVLVTLGLLLSEGDPVQVALAVLGGVGLAGWALRDVLAPVRLAVDPAGVTVVRGFAGRRRLDWASIESVSVDDRPRFGVRSQFLEIDAGDTLYLLSRHDLGTDPTTVAETLHATHPTPRPR